MRKPLISICVTVYNLEKYIGECLESILTQDFDDYELILVDNGSIDRSIEICEAYLERYPNKIKFIKLPQPTVVGRAGQVALRNATGSYFQIVDGDDFLAAGYLEDISEIIKLEKPSLIIGSYECLVEEGAIAIHDAKIDSTKINNVPKHEQLKYLFSLPNFHKTQWRFIVERESVEIREVREDEIDLVGIYGDMIGVSIWLLNAESLYYYDKPFYFYRCRVQGNMSTQMHTKTTGDFLKALIQFQCYAESLCQSKNTLVDLEIAEMMADILLKLFLSGSDLLSELEIEHLANVIDHHKKAFFLLGKYKGSYYHKFVSLVKEYGSFEGIKAFIEYEETIKIELLKSDLDKKIFIFPMGIYSVGISRLLKKKAVPVSGFLDNDITKQGKLFNGIQCIAPEALIDTVHSDDVDNVIIISTIYSKLIPTLEKQILDLGYSNIKIV